MSLIRSGVKIIMSHSYKGINKVLNPSTKIAETRVKLNCGIDMPVVGLGTYTIVGRRLVHQAIDAALAAGYRSFDTATSYENEEDLGHILKDLLPKYNLKRKDIFITSKLAPEDHGAERVYDAVARSLKLLGVSYLDLYLIHWPGTNLSSKENTKLRIESWKSLEKLHKDGKLKAIGVSNYTSRHIRELLAHCIITPAVNQVEFHIYYRHPEDLLNLCADKGILLQAYSSLGGTSVTKQLIEDPIVQSIADELAVQPAQLLLRWGLQSGFGVIPRSRTPERILSNIQLDFTLSDKQMKTLNSITHREKFDWDPEDVI